jgi:hypothetical protein
MVILLDIAARKVVHRIGERSKSQARGLFSLVLPDQQNQSPPRALSAALSAMSAAEDDAKGTRFDMTTSLPFDPPGTIAAGCTEVQDDPRADNLILTKLKP